jgi:hypothetical protein
MNEPVGSANELVCACSFADEYVMCNGCKSPDTILTKENRLFFLRCEQVWNSALFHL